jgi:hypothetical protein
MTLIYRITRIIYYIIIYIFYENKINYIDRFLPLCVYRAVCHRTDRAGTYLLEGRDAAETTDVRAPRWAVTMYVAASRPGHRIRHRRAPPENPRRPAGPWRQQLPSGRRSSGDNPLPKRY